YQKRKNEGKILKTPVSQLSKAQQEKTRQQWRSYCGGSYLNFPQSVSACISACLRDIQSWMDNHHLKLNPGDTVVSSSPTAKNIGVVMDNRLSLSQNIAAVSRTCRFFLYNTRRIRPFLTTYATQLLVQAMVLSRLDYCNSLLAGLPASTIRPLQLIQNAAARLVYNLPRHSHVTPLLTHLH
ncbi:hypothetical protein ANANG_G00017070, partial [Anguilla anguilla]